MQHSLKNKNLEHNLSLNQATETIRIFHVFSKFSSIYFYCFYRTEKTTIILILFLQAVALIWFGETNRDAG